MGCSSFAEWILGINTVDKEPYFLMYSAGSYKKTSRSWLENWVMVYN